MNITFQDLQNAHNPQNGQVFSDFGALVALLERMRSIHPPVMCQLVGDNGYNLTVGIGHDFGCAQHSSNDRAPPYLMAIGPHADEPEMQFVVGGTTTPIDGRYRLPYAVLEDVVTTFVTSGQRSDTVNWEEI